MRERKRLMQLAIWYTLQNEIRDNLYSKVSKNLLRVTNREEKRFLITQLNGTDTDIIESILSDIAKVLDI